MFLFRNGRLSKDLAAVCLFLLHLVPAVGVIILFCLYSSTVMKLMGMRNIEVLATLFLLSYAKLLKTIVTALSFTDIMVASADNVFEDLTSQKVWIYDGNINYFSKKHYSCFGNLGNSFFALHSPSLIWTMFKISTNNQRKAMDSRYNLHHGCLFWISITVAFMIAIRQLFKVYQNEK